MASETVQESVPILFLWYQNRRKTDLCTELLRSRKVLNAITEIVFNLLNNPSISLSKQIKRSFLPYTEELLFLAKKGHHIEKYQLLALNPRGHKLLVKILSFTLPYLLGIPVDCGTVQIQQN